MPVDQVGRVDTADLVVIGAGAAGLATAIFAARHAPDVRVECLDGARHIGAKILVSGGSRCNVTNRTVDERDFWGGSSRIVRSVLRAFPAHRTVAFFEELGVPLKEEEHGKLFPVNDRARTVLDALLGEARRLGVAITASQRVADVTRGVHGVVVRTESGREIAARAVVIATGGRSLPKTGSNGFGYQLAGSLGHGHVETTPGLAPLVLLGEWHRRLSGVSHDAALTLHVDGRASARITGSLLWTHFGISGPCALNLSRHWHRVRLQGLACEVRLGVCPQDSFESLEGWLLTQERERPRAQVSTVLSTRLPGAVAGLWVEQAGLKADSVMAHLTREDRRRLIRLLLEATLDVQDSRGYTYAEVTAGGVPLDEVNPATMRSTRCPDVYFAGEILDVDGRLGGFNFQWAWSSAWVAGRAVARHLSDPGGALT